MVHRFGMLGFMRVSNDFRGDGVNSGCFEAAVGLDDYYFLCAHPQYKVFCYLIAVDAIQIMWDTPNEKMIIINKPIILHTISICLSCRL